MVGGRMIIGERRRVWVKYCIFLMAWMGIVFSASVSRGDECNPPNPPKGFGTKWWREYAEWCSRCNGTPDPTTTSCTPGPNWGKRGSSSPGFSSLGYGSDPWVNVMGSLMNQFMQGFEKGLEQNRMKMDRERKEEEERLKQEEERRRQEFAKSKERMLGLMRSSDFDTIQPRDLSAELEVREVDDAFGIKTLKPKDLTARTQTVSKDVMRVHCTAYLLRKANEAFSQEKFEEAAYLSKEATDLMSGVKASPAVVCPPPPDIPAVEGGPIAESLAMSEKIKKQTLFYSRLYTRVSQQMGDYRVATSSVEQAEWKVKETRKQKEEVEAKVDELKTSKEQGLNTGSDSAMAEALAALEKAKAVYAEAEKDLEDRLHTKTKLEDQLSKTRGLFEEAQKNPEKIDEMTERLNL
jgi:hypothetical protein